MGKRSTRNLQTPAARFLQFGTLFFAAGGLGVAPASAQTMSTASASAPAQPCFVYTVALEGGTQDLRASCKGRGLMLGSTTGYRVIANDALPATLIDTRRSSERRILLISIQPDGQPLVEDLSGQIAMSAGRGPMSDLSGLDIDLSAFTTSGEIAVRLAPQDAGEGTSGEINVGQQIAAEWARRQ